MEKRKGRQKGNQATFEGKGGLVDSLSCGALRREVAEKGKKD